MATKVLLEECLNENIYRDEKSGKLMLNIESDFLESGRDGKISMNPKFLDTITIDNIEMRRGKDDDGESPLDMFVKITTVSGDTFSSPAFQDFTLTNVKTSKNHDTMSFFHSAMEDPLELDMSRYLESIYYEDGTIGSDRKVTLTKMLTYTGVGGITMDTPLTLQEEVLDVDGVEGGNGDKLVANKSGLMEWDKPVWGQCNPDGVESEGDDTVVLPLTNFPYTPKNIDKDDTHFIATVAGVYQVSYSLTIKKENANKIYARIEKNDRTVSGSQSLAPDVDNTWVTVAKTEIIKLAAKDTISISIKGKVGSSGYNSVNIRKIDV